MSSVIPIGTHVEVFYEGLRRWGRVDSVWNHDTYDDGTRHLTYHIEFPNGMIVCCSARGVRALSVLELLAEAAR